MPNPDKNGNMKYLATEGEKPRKLCFSCLTLASPLTNPAQYEGFTWFLVLTTSIGSNAMRVIAYPREYLKTCNRDCEFFGCCIPSRTTDWFFSCLSSCLGIQCAFSDTFYTSFSDAFQISLEFIAIIIMEHKRKQSIPQFIIKLNDDEVILRLCRTIERLITFQQLRILNA